MPSATRNHPAILSKPYTILPLPSDFIPPSSPSSHTSPTTTKSRVLWIGCCDSLVSETDCLVNVKREEIVVHRNFGNRISYGDLSSRSAVEWAVEVLGVQHVIVCGHYDCALIEEREEGHNGMGGWYRDIVTLHTCCDADASAETTKRNKARHFEEVYVLSEVEYLKGQDNVKKAMDERGLKVHGLVFDRERGVCLRVVEGEGR